MHLSFEHISSNIRRVWTNRKTSTMTQLLQVNKNKIYCDFIIDLTFINLKNYEVAQNNKESQVQVCWNIVSANSLVNFQCYFNV